MTLRRMLCCICVLTGALSAVVGHAAIVTVTSGADSGTGTLRQAMLDAISGDTINFSPGVSAVDLTSGTLSIGKNLTIRGPGANLLTIRRSSAVGTPAFGIFSIGTNTVTISGVTIANGSSPGSGGGISNSNGIVTLTGVAITGNSAAVTGGGIANACTICPFTSAMTITNTTISGNSAASGGGIYSGDNSSMTITNSTISGNAVTGDGGGIWTNIQVNLFSSTVTANTAAANGGGIYDVTGLLVARNSIIALNAAAFGPDINNKYASQGWNILGNTQSIVNLSPGQGDQVGVTALQLNLGPLQYNGGPTKTHAPGSGSVAIEAGNAGGATTDQRGLARPVDSPALTNASGGDGSDIGAYEVQADILPGCSSIGHVVANGNDSGAGSLRSIVANVCAGTVITFAPDVLAVTLTSGELTLGKSLSISGPGANLLTIARSAAAGTPNFRVFSTASGTNVALSGITIANGNNPAGTGGGIRNGGILSLTAVTVSGNTANAGGNGGGVYNAGTLSVTRSTISGNSVSSATLGGSGGGIFNFGGTLTIVNSTLSGNSAVTTGGVTDSGGGIFSNVGTVSLINSTITGNAGDLGGGVRGLNGAVVTMKNTIIALNTAGSGPDVSGAIGSQGFNLIGNPVDMSVSPALFSDQLGVTPAQLNLGPLQFNGGPTRTHALLGGSFALDQGLSVDYPTDQRGHPRPVDRSAIADAGGGDGSDIGAFESGDATLDIDGNGVCDALTDGILLVRYLSGLTGSALTAGALGNAPMRTAGEIVVYLDGAQAALDVDGDAQLDRLTDGLLVLRYLFGLRGAALTAGALGANATRTTPQIEAYIQSLLP